MRGSTGSGVAVLNGQGAIQGLLATLVEIAESAERADVAGAATRHAGMTLGLELERRAGPTLPLPTPRAFARLATQILKHVAPGSCLLDDSGECVTFAVPSTGAVTGAPPARARLLAAALGAVATRWYGDATVGLEPRLVDHDSVWVLSVRVLTMTLGREGPPAVGWRESYRAADLEELGVASDGDGDAAPPLAARLRALGEQAAAVAHGLNNNLAVIIGQSAALLLLQDHHTATARGLRLIHQTAADGALAVRRVLRFSRGQPLDDPADVGAIDVNEVVRDALQATHVHWHDRTGERGGAIDVHPRFRRTSSLRAARSSRSARASR